MSAVRPEWPGMLDACLREAGSGKVERVLDDGRPAVSWNTDPRAAWRARELDGQMRGLPPQSLADFAYQEVNSPDLPIEDRRVLKRWFERHGIAVWSWDA